MHPSSIDYSHLDNKNLFAKQRFSLFFLQKNFQITAIFFVNTILERKYAISLKLKMKRKLLVTCSYIHSYISNKNQIKLIV